MYKRYILLLVFCSYIYVYHRISGSPKEAKEAAKDIASSLPFLFRIFPSSTSWMKIPKRPICSMHRVLKSLLHLPKGSIASYSDWKASISMRFRHVSLSRFNERIFIEIISRFIKTFLLKLVFTLF